MKSYFTYALAAILFYIGVNHEMESIRLSQNGYYKGVVIDKTVSFGRSSTHYLYVDWGELGRKSIVVHPMTYKRTNIGDEFETSLSYTPILGAGGTAYAPVESTGYSIASSFFAVMSKIALMVMIFVFVYLRLTQPRG